MNNSNRPTKICSENRLSRNIWQFIARDVGTPYYYQYFASVEVGGGNAFAMMRLMGYMLLITFLTVSCQQVGYVVSTKASVHPVIVMPSDLAMPNILTVGSYTNYLPQEYIDPATQQVTGFDIDLIKAIAQRLRLRVNVVNADFSTLIDRLRDKQFDVTISAISITPDLQKQASFIPYFRGGESLLVRKGNPLHISNLEDVCGQKVAVKQGSFEQNDLVASNEKCQKDGKLPINIVVRSQFSDIIQLLTQQNVVASYQDSAQTDYFIKQHPNLFEVGGGVVDTNLEGIAVRKDDIAMFNAISTAFRAIVSDSTYHSMIIRWGLTSGEINSADMGISSTD